MVRIMTDNAANLPPELREQYNIREICLTYTVDGRLVDGSAPFDGHDFYEALRRGAEVKTSMISPAAAREAIEPALAAGDDVLFLGISGGVSGTCWGVGLVAQELAAEYPGRRVQVLDTRGASLGEGLVVLEVAQLAQQGADMDAIVARAETLCGKMRQHFMVDDLKFLRKGGRLSGAAALAGTLLQIKPILQGDENGKIVVRTKERGRKKAMDTLIALYNELVEDKSAPVGISHAAAPAEALHLTTRLRQSGCTGPILSVCHEPVTGAHVGPGMLAVYFYSETWR
ncbi:MAG: DegV family protein [Clostridiales bacterium]|nr:DegV family protein [Clostridiales bacterium]